MRGRSHEMQSCNVSGSTCGLHVLFHLRLKLGRRMVTSVLLIWGG